MPLYHFDTIEDGDLVPDDEGLEFTNLAVACDEAVRALGEMARDKLRCRDRQEIAISIRNGGPDACVYCLARTPDRTEAIIAAGQAARRFSRIRVISWLGHTSRSRPAGGNTPV